MSLNKNMRVVIVDDYTTMLRILRNLLRQLEFFAGFGDVGNAARDGRTAGRC
jgi:two-component system chemotaxis response regulator CheY